MHPPTNRAIEMSPGIFFFKISFFFYEIVEENKTKKTTHHPKGTGEMSESVRQGHILERQYNSYSPLSLPLSLPLSKPKLNSKLNPKTKLQAQPQNRDGAGARDQETPAAGIDVCFDSPTFIQ
jgi:hypothetical protein